MTNKLTRRRFTQSAIAAGVFGTPALGQQTQDDITTVVTPQGEVRYHIDPKNMADPTKNTVKRNTSNFKSKSWQPYFSSLKKGAVLVDTRSRALHFWSEDQTIYKLYPSSVPETADLTRLGRTSVVRKRVGPDWRPTPSMLKRNPDWPAYIPPGPENPLGTHALYLSWKYYRIHGTHDTRKIGRRSSNGCIGLFNEHIEELFSLTKVGTQVLLI